jgi:sec-independent protein translocase protein TatA
MPDWALVVVIGVVVIFGASKLPEIARNLGRSSGEFKKGLKEGDEESNSVASADATPAPPTPTPPASAPTDPPRTDTRPETSP